MTNNEIFELIGRFETSSLQSMKVTRGDCSLELHRAASPAAVPVNPPAAAAPAVSEPAGDTVNAPLVGTYYAAPAPDAPAFVSVGDRVKQGQPLCLIEAMKMMSEIPAPCDGVITEILKENGSLVSYGEPLFRYRPC